jgi:sugar/nucleoside kinase (ribokinase family)
MTTVRYDVAAIGNAIVDIIGRCDDRFLAEHGAAKGSMRLVDDPTLKALYADMGPAIEISGGSAANTAVGVASLGGRAAFIGKVADDEFGRIFAHDIRAAGVAFEGSPVAGRAPTSRSLILVTPDGERTMNTFLGISTELDHGELNRDVIAAASIVYLEGYLFDQPAAKAAFRDALAMAKSAGRAVALTLSDPFCVERHRAEFQDLIQSGIDLLFANEREAMALYESPDFETAAQTLSTRVPLAVLTRSAQGSEIVADSTRIRVPAAPIAAVVDATGAGDLYAAGFLYGLARGLDLETCGRLGSLAAAEIISHVGARPAVRLADLARDANLVAP